MGCGLRKEIEGMLSLVGGGWKLRNVLKNPHVYMYEIVRPARTGSSFCFSAVTGRGCSKYVALRELLANGRNGKTDMPLECPAGSREELELKLAVAGRRP